MTCRCTAETTHPSGRRMRIAFDYEGAISEGFALFRKRLKKPSLWYGVGVRCEDGQVSTERILDVEPGGREVWVE